ncbi:lipoprotein, partial [Cronobacter sakazakii]|nr:lipoprotein [Cronobacter sakazakii]
MKKIQLFTLITGVVMLSGCSAFQKHHGINWGNGSCPALAANQIQN